jgi:hypothetical protein
MIFRIYTTGPTNLKDWDISDEMGVSQINTIPDTLLQGASSKMGSSIPSPFARLYLFETAFRIVTQGPLEGNTMYHQLVGECLDFFRFLFYFADDDLLSIKEWNKSVHLGQMQSSNEPKHAKLASALDIFFNTSSFNSVSKIHLIEYDNILIGGTSPLTVLFTSPNWIRKMGEKVQENPIWKNRFITSDRTELFSGKNGSIFGQIKDVNYIRYMYRFIYSHRTNIPEVLFDYFDKAARDRRIESLLVAEPRIDVNYTLAQFQTDYAPFVYKNTDGAEMPLSQVGCSLGKPHARDIAKTIQTSPFIIASEKVRETKPLVLAPGGHPYRYLAEDWDSDTLVEDNPSTPLTERTLPATNIKYPYLTIGDFLESKLIELKFNLDRNHFFTGYDGDFRYLLPIKKEYFTYFSLEDLKRQLTITQKGDLITVCLRIPIQNGGSVSLVKDYKLDGDDDLVRFDSEKGFNLGIFPFYKVLDKESLNRYSVGMVSNVENIKLSFYKYGEDRPLDVEYTTRTKSRTNKIKAETQYYSINNLYFDIVLVCCESIKGIAIPLMEEIRISEFQSSETEMHFAIDLGTTNTHISYALKNNSELHDFNIEPKDRQMYFLSETKIIKPSEARKDQHLIHGFGEVELFYSYFEREFMPSYIGQAAAAAYPIRTNLCENPSPSTSGHVLFGKQNIGFFIERDGVSSDDSHRYVTDIKWAFENEPRDIAKSRLKLFIEQTLWMIKNKLLLNKTWCTPSVVWMSPRSMRPLMRTHFKRIWESEFVNVFEPANNDENKINIKNISESEAPYYRLAYLGEKGIGDANNIILIDIGGGTTDILMNYIDCTLATSFRFAGNDIWGDGVKEGRTKLNGFVKNLKESSKWPHQVKSAANDLNINSQDLASIFFKYDEEIGFTESIRATNSLRAILVLHLSAILYQATAIIKAKKLSLPHIVAFTGKGSLYLNLIIDDVKELEKLTKVLLSSFSKLEFEHDFNLIMPKRPKQVTAEGGVKFSQEPAKFKINDIEEVIHSGISQEPESLYTRKVSDLNSIRSLHQKFFEEFILCLRSNEVKQAMLNLDIDLSIKVGSTDILDLFSQKAKESYVEMFIKIQKNISEDDPLEESPFFWHLKQSLYDLSRIIVN